MGMIGMRMLEGWMGALEANKWHPWVEWESENDNNMVLDSRFVL